MTSRQERPTSRSTLRCWGISPYWVSMLHVPVIFCFDIYTHSLLILVVISDEWCLEKIPCIIWRLSYRWRWHCFHFVPCSFCIGRILRVDLDGSAYYIEDQQTPGRSWGLSAGEPLPEQVKSVAGSYHFLGEPEARGGGTTTTTTRLVRTPSAAEASTTARLIPAPTERTRQATPPPAGSRGTSANRSAGPSRATRRAHGTGGVTRHSETLTK